MSWKKGEGMNVHIATLMQASAYLKYTRERQNEARASTYEEDGGNVEAKGKGGIGKEYEGANACKREEWCEALREGENGEIDEGADRRVVVE